MCAFKWARSRALAAHWPKRLGVPFILIVTLLAACEASVIEGDAQGVWLKEPMIGSGDADGVAERYCEQYGKRSVYLRTLRPGDNYLGPFRVYDCRTEGA